MRLAIFLKNLFGYEQSESHLEHVALWVNSLGGIQHLLQKMNEHNLTHVVSSWQSNNKALSIDAAQVLEFIDFSELQPLAEKCGTDILGAANLVAQFLPMITPKAVMDTATSGTAPHNA
ncbi:YidB family protein [Klebsiella aerogenes]